MKMKKVFKKRILLPLTLAGVLICVGGALAVNNISSTAAEPVEGKGTINVYLIGGQSNAVGYGKDDLTTTLASTDARYTDGFENVLYYGEQERKSGDATNRSFVPVRIGLGNHSNTAGAEVGIASSIADNGEMNAIIKCAWGATYLYPDTSESISKTQGTWTSPSYIEENSVATEGTLIGNMYNRFVDTVTTGIEELEAQGYTPVIKGMWWMQGEAESNNNEQASEYTELLTMLINDVREDVGAITGYDCSEMPFVAGSIYRNPTATVYSDIDTVNNAQLAVASSLKNVSVVDISTCPVMRQHDSWHFDAATQNWIGQQFVAKLNATTGGNLDFEERIASFDEAKIRVDAPTGIRFAAKIADYNEANGYTYGMLIVPTDYLTDNNITGDYVNAFAEKNIDVLNFTCYINHGDFDNDGFLDDYIQASLVDLKYQNLNRLFTGIAYIKDASGNYLYTSASASYSVGYTASNQMLQTEKTSADFEVLDYYVNGSINQKNGVAEDSGYDSADFAMELLGTMTLEVNITKKLSVTLEPAMDYNISYVSTDETVATVDENGNVTGVGVGETTITVQCASLIETVTVTVQPAPVVDGSIDKSFYGANYMNYVANGQSVKAGIADVDMYWYEGEASLYLAFDVVGTVALNGYTDSNSKSRPAGGLTFLVKNTSTGEGNFYRHYANGDVRANTLANCVTNGNAYTNWSVSTTQDKVDDVAITYVQNEYTSNIVDSYIVEVRLDYADFGVTSAEELSIALGWLDLLGEDIVYTKAGEYKRLNSDLKYVTDGVDVWWTFGEIKENKTTRTIRLDGYIDSVYDNKFKYTHTNPNVSADRSYTTLYWYEDTTSLYLAFKVIPSQARTLKNSGSGSQGTAGIVFSVANTETGKGVWHRAFETNTSYKAVETVQSSTNFYSCSNGHTDYIRGNEGALVDSNRTSVVKTYIIEVRIDYADYGVTSAAGLSIQLGGMEHGNNTGWREWLHNANGGTDYTFPNTGDATAAGYVGDVAGDYYYTFAELKTAMEEQNASDVTNNIKYSVNHRGYSTVAPENTLAAYRLSAEMGFTVVECDVQFTSDGHAVLLHDGSIDRTSDGSGNITNLTLEEVRSYDFGSWKSSEYAGEKIPTFDEFMALCKELNLHPYIEIKSTISEAYAQNLIDIVNKYEMLDNVTWISFGSASLAEIVKLDNTARVGYVTSATITEEVLTTVNALKTGANEVFIDSHYDIADSEVELCKGAGIALEVWTVDSEILLEELNPYISGVTSNWIHAEKWFEQN